MALGIDVINSVNLYKSFNNCSDAAKEFNYSNATISNYLDKNKLYKKKWFLFSTFLLSGNI
jgi:hypothetical protein